MLATTPLVDPTTRLSANRDGRGQARWLGVGIAAVVLILGLTGCSSTSGTSAGTASSSASAAKSSASSSAASSSASTSYPAGKEQVCAARDDLKTSLAALTNPSLLLGGTAGISAAVKQVQTDLDAVAAAGKDDYKPQVTAVQSALTDLQTAVGSLGDGGGTDNIASVGTAIAATGTAAGALFTQLQTACA